MKRIGRLIFLGLAGGCASLGGVPGESTAQAPSDDALAAVREGGPCTAPIYRAFDFWLGTWEVTDPRGIVQGQNTITLEEAGCVLVERWTSASGGTGQSYNFVDPSNGRWRQVWVSGAANIDYQGGTTASGGMRLEGTITYRNGIRFPFVGAWTPQADGTVLQVFEQYNPQTKTWDPWFTGIYRRIDGDIEG